LLNAIGLENVGINAFLSQKLPWLRKRAITVIVNILGESPDEYAELASMLDKEEGIHALELNISCPNVKEGGMAFGTDPGHTASVVREVREATKLPVIVKLSPNVTDICAIAVAAEEAGAHCISLINTLQGMSIDIKRRRPALANVFGGLSGPAIKPIALRMVWQTSRCVDIPVIGIGGISSAEDAVEFLMAGASAVQIGTATLVDPGVAPRILQGIVDFMLDNNYSALRELRI
jgi:dihydroorotate dehydrogenase (NAD+) catalytic subunit